jgi:hypothetical protein
MATTEPTTGPPFYHTREWLESTIREFDESLAAVHNRQLRERNASEQAFNDRSIRWLTTRRDRFAAELAELST